MNCAKYLIILLSVIFVVPQDVIAQNELAYHDNIKRGAFNEDINSESKGIKEIIPYYYRRQKKLATFFTGFAIELTTSDLPLRRDYFLFERFGNIKIDPLKDGGLSYVITGFRNEKAAKTFLEKIVIHSASEAKVVVYKNGNRKVKK